MMFIRLKHGELYVGGHKVAYVDLPETGFLRYWKEAGDGSEDIEVWVYPRLRIVFTIEDSPKAILCQIGDTLIWVSPDSAHWEVEVPAGVEVHWDQETETIRTKGVALSLGGLRKAFRDLFPEAFEVD